MLLGLAVVLASASASAQPITREEVALATCYGVAQGRYVAAITGDGQSPPRGALHLQMQAEFARLRLGMAGLVSPTSRKRRDGIEAFEIADFAIEQGRDAALACLGLSREATLPLTRDDIESGCALVARCPRPLDFSLR